MVSLILFYFVFIWFNSLINNNEIQFMKKQVFEKILENAKWYDSVKDEQVNFLNIQYKHQWEQFL